MLSLLERLLRSQPEIALSTPSMLHLAGAWRTSRLAGTIQERKDILKCIVVHELLSQGIVLFLGRGLHIQSSQLIKVVFLLYFPLLSILVYLLNVHLFLRLLLVVTLYVVNGLVLSLFNDLDRSFQEHAGTDRVGGRRVVVNRVA